MDKVFRCTNGVSFGARYTTVAEDATVDAGKEVIKLTILTDAVTAGDISIVIRGATAVVTTVADTDTAAAIATAIAAKTFTGWTVTSSGAVVSFEASVAGLKTGANTVDFGLSECTGGIEIATPGTPAKTGSVTFVFKGTGDTAVSYPLACSIQVADASDVNQSLSDAVITYPSNGTVKIADGSTFKVTAGHKYTVVAQRADIGAE